MKIFQSKPIVKLVVVGLVICISFWGYKHLGASSDYFHLGEKMRVNIEDKKADTVIMKINDTPITKLEFLNQKVMLEMSTGNAVKDSEVKEKIIEYNVLWQEAKKLGLEVSIKEAQEYANQTKQSLMDAMIDPDNTDNADMIVEYINGTGKSLDEFFADSAVSYQKMLSIGKLRQSVYSDVAESISKDLGPKELVKAQQGAFESLTEELCRDANIEEVE